ncbi:MAG: hypothetical protein AAGJ08_02770 [Cyanobacteria bacterium P01_H01_bin.35]
MIQACSRALALLQTKTLIIWMLPQKSIADLFLLENSNAFFILFEMEISNEYP